MTRIHGPVVAGRFYSADPVHLREMIGDLLSAAPAPRFDGRPMGLIVPHAGIVYSGPVAAAGFELLRGRRFDTVVAIGPSHYSSFAGMASLPAEGWRTPLGVVPTTEPAGNSMIRSLPEPFDAEHCIEVELPFLQETLTDPTVTPLLFGEVDPEAAAEVLDRILGPDDLLVVSSDLSHYLTRKDAERLDARTARSIVEMRPEALGPDAACGRLCVQAALHLARLRGWRVEKLALATSADTAGDPHRVVGYGAFALVGQH